MFYLNDLPGYRCPLSCSGTRDTLCLCISADNFSFMLEDIFSLAGLVSRGGRVERKRKRKEKEREAGEKGFRSNISSYKIRLLPSPSPPSIDRKQDISFSLESGGREHRFVVIRVAIRFVITRFSIPRFRSLSSEPHLRWKRAKYRAKGCQTAS